MTEPIFCPLAGRRSIAIEMVPAEGSAGLRGTAMVAHWYLAGPSVPVHACHWIAVAGTVDAATVVDVEGAWRTAPCD